MSIPGQLSPTPRLLLGPGPSDAHPRVLAAMTTPLLGHLDPQFLQIMGETQELMRQAFVTKNQLTFPISATGSAGMEASLVNLIEPGDKTVIFSAGYFAQRMCEMARRAQADLTVVEGPWGEAFDMNKVRDTLKSVRPRVVGVVHAETSTGTLQPLEELAKLCRESDALLVADCVTSLGCTPLKVDEWQVDAAFSCSQKGLGCPPGLAPLTFGPRAVDKLNARKTKVQSWYLDLATIQSYWGGERSYHHTAPISMVYALREGLRLLLEEGLEARWERHFRNHKALKAGLEAMGLRYSAKEGNQLPQLNAVFIPQGVDDLSVRKQLLTEFGIEIGGGLGDFKGKVWRIGLMGFNCQPKNVILILAALEACLRKQGATVPGGAGVAAAEGVYATAA